MRNKSAINCVSLSTEQNLAKHQKLFAQTATVEGISLAPGIPLGYTGFILLVRFPDRHILNSVVNHRALDRRRADGVHIADSKHMYYRYSVCVETVSYYSFQ